MSRRARAREGARPWEAGELEDDGIPWELVGQQESEDAKERELEEAA